MYLIIFSIFLFGLIIGSFLNCLIWRLHTGESLWPRSLGGKGKDRSYCPHCMHEIGWYDNIPVLSFIILRGKCRHCHQRISIQYPLVELTTALLFVTAFVRIYDLGFMIYDYNHALPLLNHKSYILNLIRDFFIIAVMIVIFVYDLRWYLILDAVTLPAMVIVFILNLLTGMNWLNLLLAGAAGGGFFLIQFLVSKGRWIGGGDIRVGLLLGLALGWPQAGVALFIAYLLGSLVGLGLIASGRKKWSQAVPLGTFLSIAAIITLFWGGAILNWYLGLLLI